MSAPTHRCPCGGIPYKHPPRIEAKRVAMWKRCVELGIKRADEAMPAWCAKCIWNRVVKGLDAANDVNAIGGTA